MLPFEDRYTRQRQLPEVGLQGQTRLEQSAYRPTTVLPSLAQVVATDYLRRAGVAVQANPEAANPVPADAQGPAAEPVPSPLEHFRFSGPRDVAWGALTALNHVRAVLALESEHSVSTHAALVRTHTSSQQ